MNRLGRSVRLLIFLSSALTPASAIGPRGPGTPPPTSSDPAKTRLADLLAKLRGTGNKICAATILLTGVEDRDRDDILSLLDPMPIVVVHPDGLRANYVGGASQRLNEVFSQVTAKHDGGALYLDDFDEFNKDPVLRSQTIMGIDTAVALSKLKGFPVLIFAQTNWPERLDPALRRRFAYVINWRADELLRDKQIKRLQELLADQASPVSAWADAETAERRFKLPW